MATNHVLQGIEEALSVVISNVDPSQSIDGVALTLENILQRVLILQPFLQSDCPGFGAVVQNIQLLIDELKGIEDIRERNARSVGRPRISISELELRQLLEMEFSQVEIGKLLGCSPRTIRRRILDYGLQYIQEFSQMSDADLDELVTTFVSNFPSAGQKTLAGYLLSQGHHIQRWKIRESLLRVDPWGVEQRSRRILHRRKYTVAGPNSLWHIDGMYSYMSPHNVCSYIIISMHNDHNVMCP